MHRSTPSLKRFHCRQCSKTYTKLEHLTRHERTHTNTKPFQCKECGRSFGRQDVLGRHMKLHATPLRTRTSSFMSSTNTSQPTSTAQTELSQPSNCPILPECITGLEHFDQSTLESSNALLDSDNLMEWLMPDLNFNLNMGSGSVVPLPLMEAPAHSQSQSHVMNQEGLSSDVHQIYTLIEDLSKRLHSDLHNTGITSSFLDACLQEFFARISPCFPVIHEPTFNTRETIPPLLLNMVALGSLFVCLPDSIQKGEILWRLGHTAVATSWQTLVGLRGPRDGCDGIQVVLTALLGQTYALLSSNANIRTTALVFHGLGFYWARTCGMYSIHDVNPDELPRLEASDSEKDTAWKNWAASEVQRRAILGHYILDGLISQASGSPASARHLINSMSTTCSDAAFSAKTPDEWIIEMKRSSTTSKPLSEIFVTIFSESYTTAHTPLSLSSFSLFVVMEGLQSLVSDVHEITGPVFGTVSKKQIITALLNIYDVHLNPSQNTNYNYNDNLQLLIRWHTICLELSVPSTSLYRQICETYRIQRVLCTGTTNMNTYKTDNTSNSFNIHAWTASADAIRATLHAKAITRLLEKVPFGQAHAIHIPAAIFTSALVFGVMSLGHGEVLAGLPGSVGWRDVWTDAQSESRSGEFLHTLRGLGNEVSDVKLLNEMNFLQTGLKTVTSRWGVSAQMEEVIRRLAMACREQSHLAS